ncbi:MAG: glucodextranase DOMON-like domain-containing protein [Chloroflexota bacterium]
MRCLFITLLTTIVTLLPACDIAPARTGTPALTPTAAATVTPAEEPLYLAIIWHQHQPLYYKDPQTGIYAKPWVRMHAVKDYLDMATLVEKYPKLHVTFNLTPTLIKQLDDLNAGAKDMYQVLAEKPADRLTDDDKRYILRRFFDANPKIIKRFPGYQELADRRQGADDAQIEAALKSYSTQDFLDLQVWFNLAWMDPDYQAQEPIKGLIAKNKNFAETDKLIIFKEHARILKDVIPEHAKLQKAGQIEVTMTPYAHPILPLLYNTDLAKIAMGDAPRPKPRFSYPQDAIAQVKKGVEEYQKHFGQAPRGMWPAEGAVAQEIVKMVSDNGLEWMASDEEVQAKSLGMDGFTRDGKDVVREADKMYQPYLVQYQAERPVAIIFRDHLISDKVGFTYSGMNGTKAAEDFLSRILAIKEQLKKEGARGPHLVTVLLDGENAWEYYDNDGKEFLNALYTKLTETKQIQTVTPSEYLAKHPATRKIENLWPGSWISHDFSTWIGEDQENRGWDYLRRTRENLDKYILGQKQADQATIDKALEAMYAAEGSDWFWWYGADQDSGDDASFDQMYRSTLANVYAILGETPPDFVYVPIIARMAPPPTRPIQGMFTPNIDGYVQPLEWDKAGLYPGKPGDLVAASYFGFDAKSIYLRLDAAKPWTEIDPNLFVGVYFSSPRAKEANSFSRYGQKTKASLGFGATHEVAVQFKAGTPAATVSLAKGDNEWERLDAQVRVGAKDKVLELAVPWAALGEPETGDNVYLLATVAKDESELASAPSAGAAKVVVPDLGTIQAIVQVKDPKGDDRGPGSYTYPTDGVFKPSVFDIDEFIAGQEEKNLVFRFKLHGPIDNVWGSPNGLSVQTLDVYIDQDHQVGSGSTLLLPGRNARLAPEDAWDFAIWAEGWTPGVYKPGPDGKPVKLDAALKISVDSVARTVTMRVPKEAFGGDPKAWGYLGVLLGQEGFPQSGVWRVRDVEPTAAQWRFGGGPSDTNHTRIIDLAWPADKKPTQEEILGKYTPTQEGDPDKIDSKSYCLLPMLRAP